jgi:hypothetical protein
MFVCRLSALQIHKNKVHSNLFSAFMQFFAAEARLNNIEKFRSYRKENITLHRYKDRLVNAD